MQPIPFIAESAEQAVAEIRARLGPEAVVLNVRPLPANGLARLWQKPMIEVLAHRPERPPEAPAQFSEELAEFRYQLNEIKHQVERRPPPREPAVRQPEPEIVDEAFAPHSDAGSDGGWRIGAVLRKSGLLPLHAQAVLDLLRNEHGETPPGSLAHEINLARAVLAGWWRKPSPIKPHSLHALIGPAGSGKTTCLCKWLTQSALVEGRLARVWRLDGATANLAESLSVYCEILNLPIERTWQPGSDPMAEDIGFLDLPGVDWRQPLAIKELAGRLKQCGSPQLHLVLNGAYDISNLLAQVRAFSTLPIADIIVTHLDEEPRWGKLWNLALGTNYSIRYFATGQNIPGDFRPAVPELIMSRQFPRK
jgi:flagellar biosynthesis protein FlhF